MRCGPARRHRAHPHLTSVITAATRNVRTRRTADGRKAEDDEATARTGLRKAACGHRGGAACPSHGLLARGNDPSPSSPSSPSSLSCLVLCLPSFQGASSLVVLPLLLPSSSTATAPTPKLEEAPAPLVPVCTGWRASGTALASSAVCAFFVLFMSFSVISSPYQ